MSFFAGLVDFDESPQDRLSAIAESLWKDLIPPTAFEVSTLRGANHSVRTGILSSTKHQHGLVELRDPDYSDKIGFALFTGYLLNQNEISQQVRKHASGRWLSNHDLSNASLIGAIISELVSGDQREADLSLLRMLNGVFAFAVWLPGRKKCVLGVDRFGIRPLHYTRRDRQVGFSSEVAPLAALQESTRLVGSAIDDLVANRFILGEVTQVENVLRVTPGTFLTFSPGEVKTTKYWNLLDWPVRTDLTDRDYISAQASAMTQSIARCNGVVPNPLLLLSGGNDSRRILLRMLEKGIRPECWTAMQYNAQLPVETDSKIAEELSRAHNLVHHVIEPLDPDREDQWARHCRVLMEFDTAQHYWLLPLLKLLPANSGWNFDGYGGDFYVYDTFLSAETTRKTPDEEAIVRAARRHIAGDITDIFEYRLAEQPIEERLRTILRAMPQSENTYSQFMANVWSRRRTAQMSQRLLRHKIETVYPYLDNDLVALSYSYPPSLKVGRNFQREILLQEYPELMRSIPTLADIVSAGPGSELWKSHTRPLPHAMDLRRKRALSRSGVREIRARLPLPKLNSRTRKTAHLFALATTFGFSAQVTMRSFWRLEPIGFLGEMIRFYEQPSRRAAMLAEARSFIYD